jgi:hypothetical protein
MNTSEINKEMKGYPFGGTFPCNKIPTTKKYPCGYVINTDPSSERGEHWVAILLLAPNIGEYFDSFGLPPLCKAIVHYLRTNCAISCAYSTLTLQHPLSISCGKFALEFLQNRFEGKTYREFLALFSRDLGLNDEIVRHI